MPEAPPHRILPHLAVLPRIAVALVPIGIYAHLVTLAEEKVKLGLSDRDLGLEASILSGIVLSVLLSFRNNSAYDRWWEARKLWGQLVNDSRNMSLKLAALPELTPADRARAGQLLSGFAYALKNHLRSDSRLVRVPGFEDESIAPAHVPQYLAGQLILQIAAWREAGKLNDFDRLMLDPHVRALMDVCGACERIRTTPLASSYRSLLRIGIGVYLLVAPVYVVRDFGDWAVPIVLLVAFFMLGVEMVAHDVEEPFGEEGDDLPLDKYCTTIEKSVRETLG